MWGETAGTIVEVAEKLKARMPVLVHLRSADPDYLNAVCFYMASHLLHRPKSAQEVAGSIGLRVDRIRSIYALVYPIRAQLIDVGTLQLLAGNRPEILLAFIPPPNGEIVIVDDGEQRLRELQSENATPQQLCETYKIISSCHRDLGGWLTYCVSAEICRSGLLERRLGFRCAHLNAGIGLYMAANLLGIQSSCQRIANLVGVHEGALRAAYARIHPWADQLLQPRWLWYIGVDKMPRALQAVPMNWPPLEV